MTTTFTNTWETYAKTIGKSLVNIRVYVQSQTLVLYASCEENYANLVQEQKQSEQSEWLPQPPLCPLPFVRSARAL